jgi:rRNA maturation endonuclease Nob1
MWSMSSPGLPLGWLLLVLLALPVGVAIFFGAMAFRNATPLVFRCGACERTFGRKPHRRFPEACPLCGSADWNRS